MNTPVPENILNDLNEQLTTNPRVLVLSIKDWLTYEKALRDFADQFLSVSMKEDSPVPLTYHAVPVIMKTNEVKELIRELVRANRPVPSVQPPTTSGGVKPMTKNERNLEQPQQKKMGDLIESLSDSSEWWPSDETPEQEVPNANPKPISDIL